MLLLTWKTRRLIDSAVKEWADDKQRYIWQAWLNDNPQLRRPGGIVDDQRGALPREVAIVMLFALEQLEAAKRRRLSAYGVCEDEISDLENDITYIAGLSRDLRQIPVH